MEIGLSTHRRFAEAILKIDPNGAEAAEAHTYLLDHGDSYQRREAVMALRRFTETAAIASLALARLAANPAEKVAIRYEVITTLGMIGPAAKDAIPTLEKLTEHEDRQIAKRAKAALRQVRPAAGGHSLSMTAMTLCRGVVGTLT